MNRTAPYKNESPAFVRGLSGFRPRWTSPLLFRDFSYFTPSFVRFYSGTGPVSLPKSDVATPSYVGFFMFLR